MFTEGLYLLRKHEFILNNQYIYKIGRSNKLLNRINNYSNGTIVHLLISCDDSSIHEKKLIEMFRYKYKIQLYFGSEYFLGSVNTMKDDIVNYISKVMQYKGYKLVTNNILIERVNNKTFDNIPKYQQNIFNVQITNIPPKKIEIVSNSNINIKEKDNKLLLNNQQIDKEAATLENKYRETMNLYTCKCTYIASNEEQLLKHQAKCNNLDANTSTNFICEYCKRIFTSKYNCKRHLSSCKKKIKKTNSQTVDLPLRNQNQNENVIRNQEANQQPNQQIISQSNDNGDNNYVNNNKNITNIACNCIKKLETDLVLIKGFINMCVSINSNEQDILLESNLYKPVIELIKSYDNFNKSQKHT